MDLLLLLNATILSTTTMTIFSYLISKAFKDLYVEPILLEYVINHFGLKIKETQKVITAQLIHYIIGLVFVIFYFTFIELGYFKNSLYAGIIFGIIIGTIGIIGWKIMYRMAGKLPIANPSIYYIQLLFAHIIFGLTTVYSFYVIEMIKS